MNNRWVVVFNGSRDAYQVPLALAEADQLEALVTDWYAPLDIRWVRTLANRLPRPVVARLRRRYCVGLSSSMVWSCAVTRRLVGAELAVRDTRLGKAAGHFARSRGAGILAYSYYAHAAFAASGARCGIPRLIFQVHPHPQSIRSLFLEEIAHQADCEEFLRSEPELRRDAGSFSRLCDEPLMADRCIVASSFTKRTLVENGVDAGRVSVVPYGVDLEVLIPGPERRAGPLRVLFVGQMVARKGLKYLLEAWAQLKLPDAELTLAGRGRIDHKLIAPFRDIVQLRFELSEDELRTLYQNSDVFCMPSLAEGFGLVYLEALACGTPVIGTTNSAVADIVTNGREGWTIPTGSMDALIERLKWCHNHREELTDMRKAARRLAERYSWGTFRKRISEIVLQSSSDTDTIDSPRVLRQSRA